MTVAARGAAEWSVRELRRDEDLLLAGGPDFSAAFMAASTIRAQLAERPRLGRPRTIVALAAALADPGLGRQRQAYFLYREAAQGLRAIYEAHSDQELAAGAMATLQSVLATAHGPVHRAVAEALGSLRLAMAPPSVAPVETEPAAAVDWQALCTAFGLDTEAAAFAGRSLVAPVVGSEELLVVKLARAGESALGLCQESAWLAALAGRDYPVRFEVPHPLLWGGSALFTLTDPPVAVPPGLALHPERLAIAFVAHRDYFCYPNEPANSAAAAGEMAEVVERSAWLLGHLTGLGAVHTAPIPLFHNRVQQHRREDQGLYDWRQGGRLDRWLDSCRHPNFGRSGLRDFEHFATLASGERLYWHLGAHFLSLILVTASWFRNREPRLKGIDRAGRPVDARHLFDPDLLARLLAGIYRNYHHGFAGFIPAVSPPFDAARLAARMIEEMGVDRHMEEVLRLVDQEEMDDAAFRSFLIERGYSERQAARLERGRQEVVVHTGPHLGGFNQPISLPELIEACAAMAATCIAGRHAGEQGRPMPASGDEAAVEGGNDGAPF